MEDVALWLWSNRLTAAAFFFGTAATAVLIYTFLVDYQRLPHED